MNIKTAVAEGFTVTVVRDLGIWEGNILLSACQWCGHGCVSSDIHKPGSYKFTEFIMPVHDFCYDEAIQFIRNHHEPAV